MKPDFRGVSNEKDDDYTEEEFDYDEKKTELTLMRE